MLNEFWYAGLIALGLGVILGKVAIPLLQILKFGQVIRTDGPGSHLKKKGTPTMGGVIFLVPALVITWGAALRMELDVASLMVITVFTLGFGLVGLADDALKVVFKRPLGLLAREKLLWQFLLTASAAFVLHTVNFQTILTLPYFGWTLQLGVLYWAVLLLWGIGFSNAVNLTDGVDGLAGGTVAISCTAFVVIGLVTGVPEVVLFAASLIGGLLAFLYFNRHPARVFMGDVGSLALGGALVAMAVLTKTELLLPIIGAVYVWSTISVILQVTFFRFTGGRRLFRMAPFHHALELRGWSEKRIVAVYYSLALIAAVIGVLGLSRMGG